MTDWQYLAWREHLKWQYGDDKPSMDGYVPLETQKRWETLVNSSQWRMPAVVAEAKERRGKEAKEAMLRERARNRQTSNPIGG